MTPAGRPEHTDRVHVVLMCQPHNAAAVLRTFEHLADARDAAASRCPGPGCRRNHCIAWQAHGVIATEFVNTPPVSPCAVQLRTLYKPVRRETGLAPEHWPAPSILQHPVPRPEETSAMSDSNPHYDTPLPPRGRPR